MKKIAVIFLLVFAVFLIVILTLGSKIKDQTIEIKKDVNLQRENMKITSSAFQNNQNIPSKYTCDGDNINPALEFKDIPQNTKSLVLIMDDPDAPSGTFVHWIVLNINPAVSEIKENSVPQNTIQGENSAGQNKYTGPCPPSGTHRYFFKLYALDSNIDMSNNFEKQDIEEAIKGHIISRSQIIGLYSRK